MTTRVSLCVGFLAFLLSASLSAQGLGGGVLGIKENLDLPFDALGENEEEEDAPEIVTFYGQNLEGDGFFYVIDKSGSMQEQGELAIAKREVARNVMEFSERVRFGIFFFDKALSKFPSSGQAAEANPGMKSSALSFIQSIPGGNGSCPQLGLTAALQMANRCTSKRKVITYVGDGGGTCPGSDEGDYHRQTLAAVAAQNYQRVQINCIGVLQPNAQGEQFMRNLAAQNGGTYTRIR